jgi:hypothetical protein
MMKRFFLSLVVVSGVLLVLGCKGKGPVPTGESPSDGTAPKVAATETTGAHPGAANPHAGMGDPHAGMVPTGAPPTEAAAKPDASGMLDIGAIAFNTSGPWDVQPPKSSMRRAQLAVHGKAGLAELIVFYFGPQGAGTAQDNIDRWVGQFTNPDGSPVTNEEVKPMQIGGQNVTRVEVAGTYASSMGAQGQPQAGLADQRLIAAIVYSNDGPYYFKFLGPNATVTEFRGAFDELLASIVASP